MFSRATIILSLAFTSCATHIDQQAIPPVKAPEVTELPVETNRDWKPNFFPDIYKRAKVSNLENLESAKVANNDLEVRVWYGFYRAHLEGLLIKRLSGQWSALHLGPFSPKRPRSNHDVALSRPRSGWYECWKRLTDAGILTLPDEPSLGEEQVAPNALTYVVEYNLAGNYRAYLYTGPESSEHPEARQMVLIGQIIFEEFNLPQFRAPS